MDYGEGLRARMPVVATGAPQLPDWRFIGAAGKIEFELLHPNLASAQTDFSTAHPRVKLCGVWWSVTTRLYAHPEVIAT